MLNLWMQLFQLIQMLETFLIDAASLCCKKNLLEYQESLITAINSISSEVDN